MPRDASQVEIAFEGIFSQLEREDRLLTSLTDKLYKVLSPDYPTKDAGGSAYPASPDIAPITQTLDGVRMTQDALNFKLASLLDRIQL